MINSNEAMLIELRLEIENLKSQIDLWKQYTTELVDAKNGTGLCSCMSTDQCKLIIDDLIDHINSVRKAVEISHNRICEISDRCNATM